MNVGASIFDEDTALVRIRATDDGPVVLRGRRLSHFGQHGSLVRLPLLDALELVEAGRAKLPGGIPRSALRDAVAAAAA